MEYRELGHTGLNVSAIALGCEGFMDKSIDIVKSEINFAADSGVNFIDIYSSNPDLRSSIGAALKGKNDFYIQGHICSVWENGQYLRTRDKKKSEAAFEDLLKRLGRDALDIGMIHYVDDADDYRTVFEGEILPWAINLKHQGKIKHIGLSSHNPDVARLAVESGAIEVLMFSVNPCYDMYPPEENVETLMDASNYKAGMQNIEPARAELYEYCAKNGIGIDVMKAYGGGTLLKANESPFGKSLTTTQCLEYALTRPGVASVMVGCNGINEIKAALGWLSASPADKDYADVLSNLGHFSWKGRCMYCGHCAPCSAGIDIAAANKFYSLAGADGTIPETVAQHYMALKHHASECVACGNCESNCPFGVEIIKQMKLTAARFGL